MCFECFESVFFSLLFFFLAKGRGRFAGGERKAGKKKRRSTSKEEPSSPCCSAPWGRSRPPSVPLARAHVPLRALARGEAAEAEAAPEAGEAKEALLSP